MTMDAALADALRAMGCAMNPAAVAAWYAPLHQRQDRQGVQLLPDLPYGPDERHRVDLYRPERPGPHPVLVWLHGGGFIRGDKRSRANIGVWGAREGFVTAVANYRLAPAHRWPSGAQDVVRLWGWLQAHVGAHAGDVQHIVLAGESAGAAHVAAAALMRCHQPSGWHIAGAALFSGPYNTRLEGKARTQFGVATPDPRNDAYFGPEPHDWPASSVVDQVDMQPFPLWISWAQRDLVQMQVQGAELFARLVVRHGFAPELRVIEEHNHLSFGASFGTDDHSVSHPFAQFVRGAGSCTRIDQDGHMFPGQSPMDP